MNYGICHTRKIKTTQNLNGCEGHNSREYDVTNADSSESHKNKYWSANPDQPILKNWQEKVGNQKVRKNAVMAVEVTMTFSPDQTERIDTDQWYDECKKFMQNEFGKDNLLRCDLHMDEKTPHVQAIFIPLDESGKLNCRSFLGGSQKMRAIQDHFHEQISTQFGLDRGIEGSKAEHKPIKKWYAEDNALQERVEELKKELDHVPDQHAKPVLDVPPLTGRKQWKDDKQADIDLHESHLRNKYKHVMDYAVQPFVEASREAKDKQRIEKQLTQTSHDLKIERDKLRDIPLLDVMRSLGYQESRQEGQEHIYDTPQGHVSINPTQGVYSVDWSQKGGRGAFDLVMAVQECDFANAVSWLKSGGYDDAKVQASAKSSDVIKNVTINTKPKSYDEQKEYHAKPDPSKWDIARSYLVDQRAIDPAIVDDMHKHGDIWSNKYGAVCFGGINGGAVHIRGTQGNFKMSIGDKLKCPFMVVGKVSHNVEKSLAYCESPIDALSIAQLYPDRTAVTCGGTASPKWDFKPSFVMYDNDEAGQKAAKAFPDAQIIAPDPELGKDWNDVLIQFARSDDQRRRAISKWLDNPEVDFIDTAMVKDTPKPIKGFEL
jgi:hypothetical protein